MVSCSDSDGNISSLAASCLGQLGAVDPGLLPRKPKPKNLLPLSVHDSEFAFLALTEITRGFQNARNSVDMDAFAIAIQVIEKKLFFFKKLATTPFLNKKFHFAIIIIMVMIIIMTPLSPLSSVKKKFFFKNKLS